MGVGICLAASLLASDPIILRERITVQGEVVTLAEVADLTALPQPLRRRAAAVPVARLSPETRTLSRRDVARRARAAVPALAEWLDPASDGVIVVDPAVVSAPLAAVARAAEPGQADVVAGQPLTVRVEVGPVSVSREVQALQSGRIHQPLFVRTNDGDVLRILLEEAR